jgi:nucleoside phosphorylase
MRLICSACNSEIANIDPKFNTAILGVGYLEAAINLQTILHNETISQIIFLGTAGSYSDNLSIGDIVTVRKSSLLLRLQGSYSPIVYDDFVSNLNDTKFKQVTCLSSLEISNDETMGQEIYQRYKEKYLVENMELYAVAKIATLYNIPWEAYLGITNYINANAHQDWVRYNLEISKKFVVVKPLC